MELSKFSLGTSPGIWWGSVERHSGSVTFWDWHCYSTYKIISRIHCTTRLTQHMHKEKFYFRINFLYKIIYIVWILRLFGPNGVVLNRRMDKWHIKKFLNCYPWTNITKYVASTRIGGARGVAVACEGFNPRHLQGRFHMKILVINDSIIRKALWRNKV